MTDNTKKDKQLNNEFYQKTLRSDRQHSYKIIAKYIKKHIVPDIKSVVDYGCGAGWFLYYFNQTGIKDVVGIEFSKAALSVMDDSVKNKVSFRSLKRTINLNRKFDVAMCIEVAEHMEEKYADVLIKNITKHSDTLIFSAAPPGQGGWGHINEQPFDYWIEKLEVVGFSCDQEATIAFRRFLVRKKAKKWYCNNIAVFVRV